MTATKTKDTKDTYDEAFARLEEIVETLKSDEVGPRERLTLCREGRGLVERCRIELTSVGTEIEELRLPELLASLDRPAERAEPEQGKVATSDESLVLNAQLLLVERALEIAGEEVTLQSVAETIHPVRLVQIARLPVVAEAHDYAGYLEGLTDRDVHEMRTASTRLTEMAQVPLLAQWYREGRNAGRDVCRELAEAVLHPEGESIPGSTAAQQ